MNTFRAKLNIYAGFVGSVFGLGGVNFGSKPINTFWQSGSCVSDVHSRRLEKGDSVRKNSKIINREKFIQTVFSKPTLKIAVAFLSKNNIAQLRPLISLSCTRAYKYDY